MKKLAKKWLWLVAFVVSGVVAQGAIEWQTPKDIVGDADVNTNGVAVYAYTWAYNETGNFSDYSEVNGVRFVTLDYNCLKGTDLFIPNFNSSNIYKSWDTANIYNGRSWTSNQVATAECSKQYLSLLSTPLYGAQTDVTLLNLVPGRTYEVQLWVCSVFPESAGLKVFLDGTTEVCMNVGTEEDCKMGQHITGRFVVDSSGKQTFNITDEKDKWAEINMIQVRDVTPDASINWQVYDIMGDTDVATEGTTLYAYALGGYEVTVNGIKFTKHVPSSTTDTWLVPGYNEGMADFFVQPFSSYTMDAYSGNGLSEDYTKLIHGGFYRDAQDGKVVLRGLEIGRSYLVQLWVHDGRYSIVDRHIFVDGHDMQYRRNTGNGQYAIGRFVASARTQTINLTLNKSLSNQSFQLNALQVRQLNTDGITWQSGEIRSDEDIYNKGDLVYAYSWGNTNDTTTPLEINGVPFAYGGGNKSSLGGDITTDGFKQINTFTDYWSNPEGKASDEIYKMMRFGVYAQGLIMPTVTLQGLAPGVHYAVQIIFSDGRSGNEGARSIYVDGSVRVSYSSNGEVFGRYALGDFVARDSKQTLRLSPFGVMSGTSSGLSAQINAIQVRSLESDANVQIGSDSWTAREVTYDTDVVTDGTLLYAYTAAKQDITVNGVTFAKTDGKLGSGVGSDVNLSNKINSFYDGFASSYSGNISSGNYRTLLSNGNYNDNFSATTMTFGGLTIGHNYLVQIWVNDLRSMSSIASRYWYPDNYTDVKFWYQAVETAYLAKAGYYALGTFRASALTHSFVMNFHENHAQLNALQVRDLGAAEDIPVSDADTLEVSNSYVTNMLFSSANPLTITGEGSVDVKNGIVAQSCIIDADWAGETLVQPSTGTTTLNGDADYLNTIRVYSGLLTLNGVITTEPTAWVAAGGTLAVGNNVNLKSMVGAGSYQGPGIITLNNQYAGITDAVLGGGLTVCKTGSMDWTFAGSLNNVTIKSTNGRILVSGAQVGTVGLSGKVQVIDGDVQGTLQAVDDLQVQDLTFGTNGKLALLNKAIVTTLDDTNLDGVTITVEDARREGGNILIQGNAALTGTPNFEFTQRDFIPEFKADINAWCAKYLGGTMLYIR